MCLNLKLNNVISRVGQYQLHQAVVWDWPRLSHGTFFSKKLKHASTALLSYHKPRGNFQMTREVLEYKCNNRVIHALFFDTLAFCPACVNKMNLVLIGQQAKSSVKLWLNFDLSELWSHKTIISFWPYNKSFIDQACSAVRSYKNA